MRNHRSAKSASLLSPLVNLPLRLIQKVHRNESGSISLVSVFGLLLLVMLLGMVMNSGQQIDEKIKQQNAVDAATYSSGVVLARSMNTLAFTNHLLSDVFAMTAFLREGRDQSTNLFPEEILDNWEAMAPTLSDSEFPKFAELGPAIEAKVPREREVVRTYSAWVAAASESFLPVFESILEQRAIPQFQRSLVAATPRMAQTAMNEVAGQHGNAWPNPAVVSAALWRTVGEPVGGTREAQRTTLPVVDPILGQEPNQDQYRERARQDRDRLAFRYLADWNNETMVVFDYYAKMSQFGNLWRIFTCGQLRQLLEEEYPDDNLPFMLRDFGTQAGSLNVQLERNYQFVGTLYKQPVQNKIPGIFTNPQASDDVTYAQLMLFVPRGRLIWWHSGQNGPDGENIPQGGVPGHIIDLPSAPGDDQADAGDDNEDPSWYVTRQDWRRYWHEEDQRYYYGRAYDRHGEAWSLWNQNWTVQMVPASARLLSQILSTPPALPGLENVRPPAINNLDSTEMDWLSNH